MSSKSPFLGLRGHALRAAQIIFVVAPGFTLFGYNQAGVGPLATLQTWVSTFPSIDTINTEGAQETVNSTRKGAVIASFQIGALIGALSCLFLGDTLGRRKTIFLAAILTIIGEVLQVSAYNVIQFVVGRVILGIGVGEISVAIPVWQAECSSAAHRGRDVITAGIFMCLGYALCNWIDFGFTFIPNSTLEWRLPLALSLVLSVTVASVIFCLPESPRWLVRVNKVKQATRNLAALKDLPEDDEAIRTEIAQIESSLEFATARNNSLMEMFSKNDDERLFYRFCLCFALQFFQQMCGGNLISVCKQFQRPIIILQRPRDRANTFPLTRRINNLPAKPRTRHQPLEDPGIMRAHLEVSMLFLGLLCHRPTRTPHSLHDQRSGHVVVYGLLGSDRELPADQ